MVGLPFEIAPASLWEIETKSFWRELSRVELEARASQSRAEGAEVSPLAALFFAGPNPAFASEELGPST